MSYKSTILADTPTAYYRFNESSGTSALDSSGNSNTATINTSGITYGVAGALTNDPNKAFTFDGSTGYVDVPAGLSPTGLTTFSVECWFNTSGFGSNSRLVANGHTDSDHNGFQLYFNGSRIEFEVGNGSVQANASAVAGISNGTWYHIVGVYDGINILIYQNAVQTVGGSFSTTVSSDGHAISIGRNPVYNGDYAAATIDEVAIYDSIALSSARVTAHYNARTAFPGTPAIIGNHHAFGRIQ